LFGLNAKGSETDSLLARLDFVSGEEKTRLFTDLSWAYWNISVDSSIMYGEKAVQTSFQLDDKRYEARAQLIAGIAYYYKGNYRKANGFLKKALVLCKRLDLVDGIGATYNMLALSYKYMGLMDSSIIWAKKTIDYRIQLDDSLKLAQAYDNLSATYLLKGMYDSAIILSLRAIDVFEKIKEYSSLAIAYGNLGDIYIRVNDTTTAEKYFSKGLGVSKMAGDLRTEALIKEHLALIYHKQGNLKLALNYLQQVYEYHSTASSPIGAASALENMGSIYLDQGLDEKGINYLFKANKILEQAENQLSMASVLISLGKAFIRLKKYDQAETKLLKALKLAMETSVTKHIEESLLNLSNLYKETLKFDKALMFNEKYHTFKDSLQNIDVEKKIAELQTRFETKKKDIQILELKNIQQIEKTKNNYLKITIVFIIFFAVFAISLIVLKRKKDKQIIEKNRIKQRLDKLELDKRKLLEEELSKEVNFKTKQLTSHTLNMLQKTKLLDNIKKGIAEIASETDKPTVKKLNVLTQKIIYNNSISKDWDVFKIYFEDLNQDFFDVLKNHVPSITKQEQRFCALIKLNFAPKEIGDMLNISYNTVKSTRYKLKKKLGLAIDENMDDYICNLKTNTN
jgi:tetratricopeptide (TPR) repeat protein